MDDEANVKNIEPEAITIKYENWADIRKFRSEPNKKVVTDIGTIDQFIPKKAAALEVYREVQQIFILSISSIVAIIVVALAISLNKWAGIASAGIFAVTISVLYIKKSIEKKAYFKKEYGVPDQ